MSKLTDEQVDEIILSGDVCISFRDAVRELLELRAENEKLAALAARMAEAIDALCGDDEPDSPNWASAATALFAYRREYPLQPSALADNGGGSGTQEADE